MNVTSKMQLNSEEFSNNLDKFDKKRGEIEELLNKISFSMSKIDGYNEIWNSDTQRTVYDDYKGIEKRFSDINEKFASFSEFLKDVLDKHYDEEKTQKAFIAKNESNLDIN